jgi:hypothetical protein
VNNAIDAPDGHTTLDIRAHTGFGDITVRHATEGN